MEGEKVGWGRWKMSCLLFVEEGGWVDGKVEEKEAMGSNELL